MSGCEGGGHEVVMDYTHTIYLECYSGGGRPLLLNSSMLLAKVSASDLARSAEESLKDGTLEVEQERAK